MIILDLSFWLILIINYSLLNNDLVQIGEWDAAPRIVFTPTPQFTRRQKAVITKDYQQAQILPNRKDVINRH